MGRNKLPRPELNAQMHKNTSYCKWSLEWAQTSAKTTRRHVAKAGIPLSRQTLPSPFDAPCAHNSIHTASKQAIALTSRGKHAQSLTQMSLRYRQIPLYCTQACIPQSVKVSHATPDLEMRGAVDVIELQLRGEPTKRSTQLTRRHL